MSIKDCLDNLRQAGEINADEAEGLAGVYESLVRHLGDVNLAKAELVDRLIKQAQNEKRQKLLYDEAVHKAQQFMLNFRNARGEPDPAKALVYLMEHNGQVPMPEGMSSVAGRSKALLGLVQGKAEELLHEFRRGIITGNTVNWARLENVTREMHGQKTGDVAAEALAKTADAVNELLRLRFNAVGGNIGKLDHWFPQIHDRRALMGRGPDSKRLWMEFIEPLLDGYRMRHPQTGKPMMPDEIRESLSWIWDNITSDGWHEKEPNARPQGLGAIANRRGEHRFLIFKDADASLKYMAEYGGGADAFAIITNHWRGMAEDIAAMEILGPNPRATLTHLQEFVRKQATLKAANQEAFFPDRTELRGVSFEQGGSWISTKSPTDYAEAMVKLAEDMWSLYRHHPSATVNQRMADAFSIMRNLNVASKLGGAFFTAMSDVGFQQVARGFADLPVAKTYSDMIKQLGPWTQREARRAGLLSDTATHRLNDHARWAGGMQGPAWSRWLADRVVTWTLLGPWTQNGKDMFGLAWMGELAGRAHLKFADLPEGFQHAFKRYGITEADWDALRLDTDGTPKDVDFLKPTDVYDAMAAAGRGDQRLAERYLEMIVQETEYSTPVGTLQAQARAFGGLKRGVLRDEFLRSMGQFKMFAFSVAILQGQRVAYETVQNGLMKGAGYAFALLFTTTLYGALSSQMREIMMGRDPRPMTGEKSVTFWSQALARGGGLGIYADVLASETGGQPGGFARLAIGPTGDSIASLLSLTSGNMAQLIRGDKNTNVGREFVKF